MIHKESNVKRLKSQKYVENNRDPVFLDLTSFSKFYFPCSGWNCFKIFVTCI